MAQKYIGIPQQTLIDRVTGKGVDKYLENPSGKAFRVTGTFLDISPYYQHIARLQAHRNYASELSSDLISAKVYSGKHPAVYVLIKYGGLDFGLIYTPHNCKLRRPETVELLTGKEGTVE